MENAFNSEFADLRKIVPPEVWQLIAEKLLKPGSDDLENLANSSAFFQDLLASQRTTYLFEEVFPLVASSVWESEEGLEGMPVSEVLKLRGICSHWSTVIDKLINEKFQCFGEGSQEIKITRIASAFKSLTSDEFSLMVGVDDVENKNLYKFLSHFEATHPGSQPNGRSPFTSGYVFVDTGHNVKDEEYYRFLEGVTTMLAKYGSHIQYVSLHFDGDEFFELEKAAVFQKWFSDMPNLKELSFKAVIGTWWSDWDKGNASIHGWEFPKYQRLEELTIRDLPVTLFNPLIRQNSHVSTLFVESVMADYDFFTCPLPNLTCLKMGYIWEEHVEKLSCLEVQWPLEKLSIEFADHSVSIGCSALFKLIQEKFAKTLVSLEIDMVSNEREIEGPRWLDMKNYRLQLPELRKVKLCMNENKVSLDFLLGMKHNLEKISVQVFYKLSPKQEGTWTSGTIVQFMGFEGKMLESNIWILFKKLKTIKVTAKWEGDKWESKWYSRDDWMLNNEYI